MTKIFQFVLSKDGKQLASRSTSLDKWAFNCKWHKILLLFLHLHTVMPTRIFVQILLQTNIFNSATYQTFFTTEIQFQKCLELFFFYGKRVRICPSVQMKKLTYFSPFVPALKLRSFKRSKCWSLQVSSVFTCKCFWTYVTAAKKEKKA